MAFVKDILDAGMGEAAKRSEKSNSTKHPNSVVADTCTAGTTAMNGNVVCMVQSLVSQSIAEGMERITSSEAPMINKTQKFQFAKFVEAFTNDLFVQGLRSSIDAMTLMAENENIQDNIFVTTSC